MTGDLTEEEWSRLNEHLARCNSCLEIKQQYELVFSGAIPAMAAESSSAPDDVSGPGSWSIEDAEAALMKSIQSQPVPSIEIPIAPTPSSHWKQVRRYAIAALILGGCTFTGYHVGVLRERGSIATTAPATSTMPSTLSRPNVPGPAAIPAPEKNTGLEENAGLRNQARTSQSELARLKDKLSQADNELARRSADLDQSLRDRGELTKEVAQAQANAQSLESRLAAVGNQTSQDTAELLGLKTRIQDLNASLGDKDKEIAGQQELLQRDRDIRNLIGARNLYIAEIYDVAKTGDTQKPFGRVFYTKDKSLVFYGYDLDQQKGVKNASTFQAWGSRGADRQHAVSLGLLYQDDANQKRWVLKFKDAKTIAQIDAVFITIEPEGGSPQPTGKALLFTYLRLDPNHP
ncbi:MAG TPA: hypothetical protein VGI45_07980 [Terracidiphilus sp.]|jgi:hypothetical protein